jgi:benzoyl-CoA reductase subunit A
MHCYVGIDLGSTTTKAVILDADRKVLGRGITNSRSNYDVACEVARGEALLDARFRLFERGLSAEADLASRSSELLARLRRLFRLEQHLALQAELEEVARMHAGSHPARDSLLLPALERLFAHLREEAPSLFAASSAPLSDFFRDLAGTRYMAAAETLAKEEGIPFETFLGLWDSSILTVESHPPAAALHETMTRALDSLLRESPLPDRLAARLRALLGSAMEEPLVPAQTVGTGYGRARLPFPRECIRSEILCHGLGAHELFPRTRTVLDIGGQDTKAIQIDEQGLVGSFQMNDRCAAGCGRYLGYIADEMNLSLHELGPLARCSKRAVRINSTCTVFAGAELRDRLASGQRREDILAGLHRAIVLRALSLLARSGGVSEEFTFTGGVARNEAAVEVLSELVRQTWGMRTINVSPDSIYTGALGAALFARRAEEEVRIPAHAARGGAA